MALGTKESSKTYWLKPVNGKLELVVKEKREGFSEKEVETSDGKKVTRYVKEFDTAEGFITDVKSEDGDYGKRWVITLADGDEIYYITFKYSSGYSKSFLNQIENVNLEKPVRISCSYKEVEKNGKMTKNTAIWINQKNDSSSQYDWVGFKYSKDNPQGRPELKELVVRGDVVYDDTDQLKYYEGIVNSIFNDRKFKAATGQSSKSVEPLIEESLTTKDSFIEVDDLPF